MAGNGALSARQRRFVAAVIAAPDVRAAAGAAGIGERTAWTYLAMPEIRAELAARQDAVIGHVARQLGQRMGDALEVLTDLMHSAESEAARVSAARAVLDTGLKLAELVSLQDRVAALEALLGGET